MGWVSDIAARSRPHRGSTQQLRYGAKAKITAGESVLLVREQHADGSPFWTLPGGGVEAGESPRRTVRREIREELSCDVFVGDAVGTICYAHRSSDRAVSLYRIFECSLPARPRPNVAEGVYEYRWVHPGAFPSRTLPQIRGLCEEPA